MEIIVKFILINFVRFLKKIKFVAMLVICE